MARNPGILRMALLALTGLTIASRGLESQNGADSKPTGRPPTAVRVGEVRQSSIGDRRFVTGEIRAARRAAIAGREPGLVLEMPVREGQHVKAGALLARVDARRLELERLELVADRAATAASLEEYEADLALRRWQQEALQKLESRGSSFERELREVAAGIAVAVARKTQVTRRLAVLDARRDLLEQRTADTRITAPFDAIVVARRIERGEWLPIGGAVADLIAARELEAWFQLPESLASAIRVKGITIEVRVDAVGYANRATAFRVVPLVNAASRTFPLVVPLADGGGALNAGMSATAWVPNGATRDHLTVPKDALLRGEVGPYVYVARGSAPAIAAPAPVEVLFSVGDRVAVRSTALAPGDFVVTEGNERLFPSMPIAFEPPAPEAK